MNEQPVTYGQLRDELDRFEIRFEQKLDQKLDAKLLEVERRLETRLGQMITAMGENLRSEFRIVAELVTETRRDVAEHKGDARLHDNIRFELEAHRLDRSMHRGSAEDTENKTRAEKRETKREMSKKGRSRS